MNATISNWACGSIKNVAMYVLLKMMYPWSGYTLYYVIYKIDMHVCMQCVASLRSNYMFYDNLWDVWDIFYTCGSCDRMPIDTTSDLNTDIIVPIDTTSDLNKFELFYEIIKNTNKILKMNYVIWYRKSVTTNR